MIRVRFRQNVLRSLRSTSVILTAQKVVPKRNYSEELSKSAHGSDVQSSTTNTKTLRAQFDPTKQYSISKCNSCGISLQSHNPKEVGYYLEPKTKRPTTYQSKKLQYVSAFAKLDKEGRALLGNEMSAFKNNNSEMLEDLKESLVCKRCHDALHHSVYNPEEHIPMNFSKVMESIPQEANVVHVFSAYDFPLSLVNIKDRRNVFYVMNKTDLLFGHGSGINKYQNFFKGMVHRLTGEEKNIHLISAYTNWGIADMFKKFDLLNYMVGYVNTGKTRLCNRLLNYARQTKNPGSKVLKPEGSSHLPALTRENIEHDCLNKSIIDVPGFLDESGVFQHIQEEHLKLALQGKKVLVSDLRDSPYQTVKGGQCFTVGGTFFLLPPEDSILQVKPVVYGEPKIFTNLQKAVEIVKDTPDALKKFVMVKPESMNDLVRYVIPPFYGAVDLLIKDIGYVQITPTGAKKNDNLFEVWAPRGVVLGVRETIEHFLSRYLKRIQTKKREIRRKGDLLRVEKKEKLKMKAKPIPDYKIFSRLYEIPHDCEHPMDEVVAQYARHVKQEGNGHNVWRKDDYRDESTNNFWIEKV